MSIAAGGIVPTELSFFHAKYKRLVVPEYVVRDNVCENVYHDVLAIEEPLYPLNFTPPVVYALLVNDIVFAGWVGLPETAAAGTEASPK